MSADHIHGRDVYGDAWSLSGGDSLIAATREAGAVAFVDVDDDADSVALSQQDAARWGLFLLHAAGVNIVEPARNVADRLRDDGEVSSALLDVLVAELAKLDEVQK